jgi:hypothetical protein
VVVPADGCGRSPLPGGTTAATLRAGVPSVPVPVFADGAARVLDVQASAGARETAEDVRGWAPGRVIGRHPPMRCAPRFGGAGPHGSNGHRGLLNCGKRT